MKRPSRRDIAYHAVRWIWVPVLAAVAYLAFPRAASDVAPLLEPGAVAEHDVIAPFSFVVNKSDDELSHEAEALAATAKPIYEFDQRGNDSATTAVGAFFAAVNAAAGHGAVAIRQAAVQAGVPITAAEAEYLGSGKARRRMADGMSALFFQTLAQGVASTRQMQQETAPELIVRRGSLETSLTRDHVLAYPQYLLRARSLSPDPSSSVGDGLFLKLAGHFFRPTLILNAAETERRRDDLRKSVDRNKYVVRAGDRIVGAHEIVTSDAAELLRRGSATSGSWRGVVGPLLRDGLVLAIFWVLMLFYRRETYYDARQVAFVAFLFAAVIGGAAAVARFAPEHPELIPLPFAAIMLTVLFNGRVSMVGALILSTVIGSQPVFHDTPALFLCMVGGVTAALSVRSLRRRSHLYAAVLVMAGGFLAGSVALGLAGGWPWAAVGVRAVWGMANGLVSASLTSLLLPIAESFTHITTDLRLLELSDPSRPLLKRMSLEAPGTYAHSIAMANLVEAACNRVGANGLLGRVGCYYHDVGKLTHPQFFVENQGRGGNPHDRLSPRQSAEMIRQHVTDGLALAAEARLPDVVAAFIPEHHGTSEISYFLERAKKQGEIANRDEFRYPGPKPRSIETAVAMLADSVEAALRVLDDLTPQRIEEAIEHIARQKIAAGQLDDAPMTMRQIDDVKAEFVRVLSGMHHHRIDYPESSGGITATWQPAAGA